MNVIIKSILMLSQEKLQVLSEELNFLYDICNYHAGETNDESNLKKDLEDNFLNLKKQLVYLSDKTLEIDKKIKIHFRRTDEDERELLYFIDYYQRNINNIIKKLKLVNEKTYQMFRDGYNQYIPKPTPGRMISNINMTSQVEMSLYKRLKSFLVEGESIENYSTQIIWEYEKFYKIKIERDTNIIYFRMSYWYFDLPYLIPALTHEMSHLALAKDEEYKSNLEKIVNSIKNKVENSNILFIFKNKKIPRNFIEFKINEILADVLSLLHHGNSYIFTMSHELLGYYFASTFSYSEHTNSINIASWNFNEKRDSAFIRLSVLLYVQSLLEGVHSEIECDKMLFNTNTSELKELKKILKVIYSENEIVGKSFKDYYQGWHNYIDDFKELETFIIFFINSVNEELKYRKDWLYEILKKTKKYDSTIMSESSDIKLPKYYNDLWEIRFENLNKNLSTHKYELRKKIHFNTLTELSKKKLLDLKNVKPFILTFYKYKIDSFSKNKDKSVQHIEMNYESTLGIYDRIDIVEEIVTSAKELKKLKIDKKDKEYHLKFSLMKIMNDIEGKSCFSSSPSLLNVLIQVEIKKNLNKDNTYDDLVSDLEKIYGFFKKNRDIFAKIQFFKSLGPKDITLRIEQLSIDSIYMIKSYLAKEFDRTFSTISYTDTSKLYNILSTDKYGFITELRLSSNIDKLKLPIQFKEKISDGSMITGVMDYTIRWEKGTSIEDIEEFYNEMIGQNMVSDIQTQFVKLNLTTFKDLFVAFKN